MVNVKDQLNQENVQVVLLHYPMAEWSHIHRGAYHLFGHIHNRMDDTYYFMKARARVFNAGCILLDELKRKGKDIPVYEKT